MTFKLPNPVGDYYTEGMGMFVSLPNGSKLYSGTQLLRVRRDALEEAAKVCRTLANKGFDVTYENADSGAYACEDAIRKLKDET
jgi:hypothetical protein